MGFLGDGNIERDVRRLLPFFVQSFQTLVDAQVLATVGGRILVASSSHLTADIAAGDSSITVAHSLAVVGDILYLEARGNVEYMTVTSGPTGTGPYVYGVTRNVDGSGANAWAANDAVVNTGQTGSGFLELFQDTDLGGHAGPALIAWGRNSNAWNDISDYGRVGNLNGSRGYSSSTWGAYFGKYASGQTWVSVDASNGFRVMNYTTQVAKWAADGTILIGQVASGQSNVYVSSGDLIIRNNTTEVFKADRYGAVVAGVTSAGHVWITNGDILLRQSTTEKIRIDHTGYIRVGEAGVPNLWLYGSAIQMRDASDQILLDISAGIITLGAAAGHNIWLDGTAIKLRYQSTDKISLTGTGNISLTGDLALGTAGAIRAGATAILTGDGLYYDYNGGTPRFRVGTVSGGALTAGVYWSGSALTIAGATSITGSSASNAHVLDVASTGSGTSSIAVFGSSANYYAVVGDSPGSAGVVGKGALYGVYGFTYGTGIGVYGSGPVGVAAYGTTTSLDVDGAAAEFHGQNINNVGTITASIARANTKFNLNGTDGLASQVVALAKLTAGGSDGSITVTGGIVTAYTAPT